MATLNRDEMAHALKKGQSVVITERHGVGEDGKSKAVKHERLISSVHDLPSDVKTGETATDDSGRLSRKAMELTIKQGGSVLISDGTLITSVDDLPTEADLDKIDADRAKAVSASLDDQIARLQSQKSSLSKAHAKDK